jgi:hypothetical protein
MEDSWRGQLFSGLEVVTASSYERLVISSVEAELKIPCRSPISTKLDISFSVACATCIYLSYHKTAHAVDTELWIAPRGDIARISSGTPIIRSSYCCVR